MSIIRMLCTKKYLCFFVEGGDLKRRKTADWRLKRSMYGPEGKIRGKEKDERLGTKLTARLALRNW